MKFGWWRKKIKYNERSKDIDPDEIFVDSSNLPDFDTYQFEGRLEKSISRNSIFILSGFLFVFFLLFLFRVANLQIYHGHFYFNKSENNRLRNSLVFSKRGIIYDRNNTKLAWNIKNIDEESFDLRQYTSLEGFSNLLGYLKYPTKDKHGFYFTEILDGKVGIEKHYNDLLAGENGKRIIEVNALNEVYTQNIIRNPKDGDNVILTIDAEIQNKLFVEIKNLANRVNFTGGAGVIMNVNNGEILALTTYPEISSQILTDGQNQTVINEYFNDKNTPALNRAINGLYAPGSTIKPYMAFAVLEEKIIDPNQNIYSGEYLSLPNPYDSSKPTIFRDWKVHGYVDMKKALAVSSDIYFYTVGGGFENQKGLGILNIDKYMKMFGFGEDFVSTFFKGTKGSIPTPEWKKGMFPEDPDWRVGNTYHTSIGQYGFQVTPMQMVRAVAILANGGKIIEPKINIDEKDYIINDLNLNIDNLKIVRAGMRDSVIKDYGVARGLNSSNYSVAAKTGTAELGVRKEFVNSWITGFWPYEKPLYAFVVVMEKGPEANTIGALSVMRQVLDFMVIYKADYLQ